jgi:O-antigen/teichoic acid export membrane protein
VTQRGAFAVLGGHTLVYLAGSLAAKFSSLLLLPITTRLDRADFGVLELVDATLMLLLQIAGFQLDAALTRRYLASDDPAARRRVVGTAFLAVATLCTVAVLPLVFLAAPLASLLFDDAAHGSVLRLTAAILVAILLSEVPLALLKAERRSVAATSWQLVRLLVEIGLKILFLVGLSMGVVGVLLGQAIAGVAFLIGAAAWLFRRHGLAFDRDELRALVAYSAPMVVAGLCQFALHSSDRFLFRAFSNLDQLGLYGVGYKLGFAPTSALLAAFLLVWYPYVFSLRDDAVRARLIARATVLMPSILLCASLPVALFAPEIVIVFTDRAEYHAAWPIIPIVLFAYLFWGLFQIVQTPFYVHSRTAETPKVVVRAILVNLLGNLALLPWLGAIGAALATVLGMVALAYFARRSAQRIEAIAVDWRRLGHLAPPCVATLLALLVVTPLDPASLALRGGVLIVSLGYLVLRVPTAGDRVEVVATWRRLRGRVS